MGKSCTGKKRARTYIIPTSKRTVKYLPQYSLDMTNMIRVEEQKCNIVHEIWLCYIVNDEYQSVGRGDGFPSDGY